MRFPRIRKICGLLGLAAALGLSACAPGQSLQARNNASGEGSVSTAVLPTTCSSGWIYNESLDGLSYSTEDFRTRVQNFVSATLDPQEIGNIEGGKGDDGTHVSLSGVFSFNSAGDVIPASTHVDIEINDSYVGTTAANGESIGAYPVRFTAASSGHVDRAAKSFTVVFEDQYGSVTFEGHYSGTQITGEVSYSNTSYFDGSQSGKSGALGAFALGTCALSQ